MFLFINKLHVVDYDTWKIVPRAKMPRQSICHVPSFFWSYKGKDTHKSLVGLGKFNTYKLTLIMQLNGFTVQTGVDNAIIRIQIKDGLKEFQLRWTFGEWGNHDSSGFDILDNVTYDIRSGSEVDQYVCKCDHIFDYIEGLSKAGFKQFDNSDMQFGISEKRLRVTYKDKELNGTTYALIYGPWAILLSDDMKFDSLVYLDGLRYGTLYIHKIVYTVNTYVMKVMMLF